MKPFARFLPLAALFAVTGLRAQVGSVTLNFTLGQLNDAHGAALADGALLQILAAAPATAFTPANLDAFTADLSSETLLWQGAFDSSTVGLPGAMLLSLESLDVFADGSAGNVLQESSGLLVRWFPELSGTAIPTAPGATVYGQWGYGAGDDTWVLSSVGGSLDFTFLTAAVMEGGYAAALGDAGLATSAAGSAVPEPGTYAALAGLAALSLALQRRRTGRVRREPRPASSVCAP